MRHLKCPPARRIRDVFRQPILAAVTLLSAALVLPAMAGSPQAARHEVDIGSQSMATALQELTEQTGLRVLSQDTDGVQSPGAHGDLTADETLAQVLGHSGLSYQMLDENTVAIRIAAAAPSAQAGPNGISHGAAVEEQQPPAAANPQASPAAPQSVEAPPPLTNSSEQAAPVPEVVVTGSRIKRKEYESNSPLVTVDSEQLEQRSGLNIESYLNQLPNYNPSNTPTSEAQDVEPTALNTVGISTISLRGLGANRSLVLIDGHRATPVNALMVTDINTIPSSLIERIETVSGGESAVYGADAMGGVTNFILKKSFQGLQVDVQDGISQVGDDNELRLSVLMGTKFADGRGNIIMGAEYYDRAAAYENSRDYFTNEWANPNAVGVTQPAGYVLRLYGTNGYSTLNAAPSAAAVSAILPQRNPASLLTATNSLANAVFQFNNGGTLFASAGPLATSNYAQFASLSPGVLRSDGYALQNSYNSTQVNSSNNATPPGVTDVLKWANPTTLLSLPQTRYSFYADGRFDITDDVQFFTNVRFAESLTQTRVQNLMSLATGWDVEIPYNQATDDPIKPGLVTPATPAATVRQIAAAFANGTAASMGYTNPAFVPIKSSSAQPQHPVPWQLALLLDSRSLAGGGALGGGAINGGPAVCNTGYTAINATTHQPIAGGPCSMAATSWQLSYLPSPGELAARSTTDTDSSWQIETGLDFPLHLRDWTGELYYSRGQSLAYQDAFGNDSLERIRAIMDAPGYGQNVAFQGNAGSSSPGFGTSVPAACTSGYYDSIFNYTTPSADCQTAAGTTLQTMTQVQQDIVEANFQGSLLELPAGTLNGALGYQYRRDSAQFVPDTLQSTNSFLDQVVGVYPSGSLDAQTEARDGYAELLVPLAHDLPFLQKLDLDVGGRYSSYNDSPNATTFKVDMSAKVTDSLRVRGGFDRATRTPNLGELFLNLQEYLGTSSVYGDPCSLRSLSPFGAANAPGVTNPSLSDATLPAVNGGKPVNSNGAAGANSTYLICREMMGGAGSVGANTYYNVNASQAGDASPALIGAFQNQVGNPNLQAETADTWTTGIVLSHLSDQPLLSDLSVSADYYRISIKNAIELEGSDYANYLCYGAVQVASVAAAQAQANTPACQNVSRNLGTGGPNTIGLEYNNLATIATAGVDLSVNWMTPASALGLKFIPGSFAFSTQSTWLNYYRTKASPLNFDVSTDWKGSLGPTLTGTDPGAYTWRSYTTFSWVMPSFSIGLHWQYLPSVSTAAYATQEATIAHNMQAVAQGRPQDVLSYTPITDLGMPHYNNVGLSFEWTINKMLQLRGGIDNLFNAYPAYLNSRGYTSQAEILAACSTAAKSYGCVTPASYSLPNSTIANLNTGFYDTIGRRFYLGFKAQL